MDDRVNRLLEKAEQAIDMGNLEQAESYQDLASVVDWYRKRDARQLRKALEHVTESP